MLIVCFRICMFCLDGYTTDDVIYLWKYGNNHSVEVNEDMTLAQFDLIKVMSTNNTRRNKMGELYKLTRIRLSLKYQNQYLKHVFLF